MESALLEAAAEQPLPIDGGLATQLEAQGHDLSSDLWSARLLVDNPAEIVAAHRRFFDAGARVAISASYQASFGGLAALGFDQGQAAALMTSSVTVADRARSEMSDDVERWVAASVGPYGAALADGSEYSGRYGLGVAELRRWHRPRLEVLASSGADLLAMETIPCLAEAEALLREVDGTAMPAWLTLSCAGGRTRAGEPVDEAFAMASEVDEILAVGVNCTDAAEVAALVDLAAHLSSKPVVVYPNSGEGWDAAQRAWTGDPSFSAGLVADWVERGARLIGGCCRVGPAEIAAIGWAGAHRNVERQLHPGPARPGAGIPRTP
jgi:homocysteine S-methyltransferase